MLTEAFFFLVIIGGAYFFASAISANFYTALYPIVNDYFWAKIIMFMSIYLGISVMGFFLIIKRCIDKK